MKSDISVSVNGEVRRVTSGLTVRALLGELGFGAARVAVEINLDVVARTDFDSVVVADGDRIEIVSFVGGG